MRYVFATDAKQCLAAILDAAQREPVVIRRQKCDVAVVLSPQEYERLRALNRDEFQRFCDRVGAQAAARGMTGDKLADVLARLKFDPYVSIEDRQEFLRLLGRVAEMVPFVYAIHDCRDPKDNKLLEVAVNGEADAIVTGDEDLLVLNPYRGIRIVTPSAVLGAVEGRKQ